MQSKLCLYSFFSLSRVQPFCSRAASVSKTCPKAAVSYAARPICFTLVSFSLSLLSLVPNTHKHAQARTRRVTHKTGGHPWSLAASSSKADEMKEQLAVFSASSKIATASPTAAECLHSDTLSVREAAAGVFFFQRRLRMPRCVKWKLSVRSDSELAFTSPLSCRQKTPN